MTKTELIFKNNILNLRKKSGISKYKICKETGINYSYYSRLEDFDTETVPRFHTMEKLAEYYKVTVESLFKE